MMNNEKMIKTANTAYKIVSVLRIIVTAGIAVYAAGLVLMMVIGMDRMPLSVNTLSFGTVTLHLAEGALPDQTIGKAQMLGAMLPASVILAVVYYVLTVLRRILEPMKEGRTFETDVSDNIRRLATAVLAGGILSYAAQTASGFFFRAQYDALRELFKEGVVDHITVTYSFSLNFVFAALVLYLLSYIVRYGEELQRQSDETL